VSGPVSCRAVDEETGYRCLRRRWHWGLHRAELAGRDKPTQVRWRGRRDVLLRLEWVPR
jgi:hypothetical protein